MAVESRIFENQRAAAILLIDELKRWLTPGRPFLAEIRRELGMHRGFGSRDRRLYRELIFTWLRYRAWFEDLRSMSDRAAVDLLVALSPEVPEVLPLQSDLGLPGGIGSRPWPEMREKLGVLFPRQRFELRRLMPKWFELHCPALFEESEILVQLQRPPFWLRVQRGTAAELVRDLSRSGIAATASTDVPGAVRITGYVELEDHEVVTSGRTEIQDIGSQALLAMAAPEPGGHWLDLCAGAGGKSLQLASLLGARGKVTAHDVRREALVETKRRMTRAGVKNITIESVLPDPGFATFDGVLVDAPCSASGTWRRHPFLRHQASPTIINRQAKDQVALLEKAANYLAPARRLIYATCSLSDRENNEVVATFLQAHRDFRLEPPLWNPGYPLAASGTVTLMPSVLDSDGYFLACLRRET